MDIFTQIILGSSVGGMIASKKIGNKAFLWGAAISVIPDLDMLIVPFLETTKGVLVHHGFSHSVFFFLLVAPFLGLLIKRLENKTDYTLAQWTSFSFFILLTHSFLDVFTTYGTGLLEPFWDKRFALSSISVVDPFFTVPLLVFFIIALRSPERRLKKAFSWVAVFVSVLYLSFTFLNKLYIQSEFEQYLVEEDVRYDRTEVFPQVGSNFTWNCIAQDRDGFWVKKESNFTRYDSDMQLYLRNDYYMFDYLHDERIKNLQRFSKGYYSALERYDGTVDFRDLRFGKFVTEHNGPFVFTFRIIPDTEKRLERIDRVDISLLHIW
ncbi:MAG: metal-dependent hydrolase [Bacteroidales bacterium]